MSRDGEWSGLRPITHNHADVEYFLYLNTRLMVKSLQEKRLDMFSFRFNFLIFQLFIFVFQVRELPAPDTVRDTRKLFESVKNLSATNVDKSTKIQSSHVSQSHNNRHSHDGQKSMKKDENNLCRSPEFKITQEKVISSKPAVPFKPSNLKHKTENK